ncbi:hypothetical protein NFI96_014308, partial [Prochilodus magdalenae]
LTVKPHFRKEHHTYSKTWSVAVLLLQDLEDLLTMIQNTPVSHPEWLKKNKVKTLEWPSQSPGLNPIVMLWHDPMWLNYNSSAKMSGPKFLHSAVKDSLQVTTNT